MDSVYTYTCLARLISILMSSSNHLHLFVIKHAIAVFPDRNFRGFQNSFFLASYPRDLLQLNFPLIITYKVNGTNCQNPDYAVFSSILLPSFSITSKFRCMAPVVLHPPPKSHSSPSQLSYTCTRNVQNFAFCVLNVTLLWDGNDEHFWAELWQAIFRVLRLFYFDVLSFPDIWIITF
jgi:hypothetical protein